MKDICLLNVALNTIEKNNLIQNRDRILVGVSGGPDSMCLLNVLKMIQNKYSVSLFVVHVNHMLRGLDSERDEKFVKSYCKKIRIPFYVERHDVKKYSKSKGLSIEESAREIRYNVFRAYSNINNIDKIAVAHNKNDQVETSLMRILRGTGLDGITAMDYKANKIIRPLLDIKKVDILFYCNEMDIKTTIDKSNLDRVYTRNKIRLDLIPYLEKEFNVDIIDRIHNMALLLNEDKKIVNEYIKTIFLKVLVEKNNHMIVLDLEEINKYSDEIIKRVLRIGIIELSGNIAGFGKVHIDNILKMINSSKTGKYLDLPKNLKVNISYNKFKLYFDEKTEKLKFCKKLNIPKVYVKEIGQTFYFDILSIEQFNELNINLSEKNDLTGYFDFDKIDFKKTFIRNRKISDFIVPYGYITGKKKLKDYFIDLKMSRDIRDKIPLLAVESEVVWIVGYRTSNNYKITNKTKKVLKIKVKNKEVL
ncbi:MAG: tRNA lysidine(34) synthetase TilS [Clostridiales bacterium]